jgi:hypothetical protein
MPRSNGATPGARFPRAVGRPSRGGFYGRGVRFDSLTRRIKVGGGAREALVDD